MNLDEVRDLLMPGELLSAKRFDEYQQAWREGNRSDNEGEDFIRWLVSERELTEFQGQALLAGISGPYMFGPYRVTARITAGRLGDIFQAEHVEFQQPVSLKVFPASLSQDAERLARMGREARVSLQMDNPYVVKTYQIGRISEVPFIVLEALKGETLEQRLDRDGRIPYVEACQLIQQAARGLAYLHSLEIVHRDICPANLWISDQGNVRIMEFGAARDALSFIDSAGHGGSELTLNSHHDGVLGTYAYMSAAQAENPHNANESSDLYSLGCTFYHCLTGQVPFPEKNPVRQMLRHAGEQPRPLSDFDADIPQAVEDFVSYLLAKQPEDRYGSAEETAEAFEAIIPKSTTPVANVPAPAYLAWVQEVDGEQFSLDFEKPQDPEWLNFVDWLSHPKTQ